MLNDEDVTFEMAKEGHAYNLDPKHPKMEMTMHKPTDEEVKKEVAEWMRGGAKCTVPLSEGSMGGSMPGWTIVRQKDLDDAAARLDPPEKLRLWVLQPESLGDKRDPVFRWSAERPGGEPCSQSPLVPTWTEYAPIEKVRLELRAIALELKPVRLPADLAYAMSRIAGHVEAALKEID